MAIPRAGDTVLGPDGERHIVAWVEGDELVTLRVPKLTLKTSECQVVRQCTQSEHDHIVLHQGPFVPAKEAPKPEAVKPEEPAAVTFDPTLCRCGHVHTQHINDFLSCMVCPCQHFAKAVRAEEPERVPTPEELAAEVIVDKPEGFRPVDPPTPEPEPIAAKAP
jgi:hypothetical protein